MSSHSENSKTGSSGRDATPVSHTEPTVRLNSLQLSDGPQPAALVGSSNAVIALRATISEIARRQPIVALIVGSTGSGRRQVASAIHRQSEFAGTALRYIDCYQTLPVDLDAMLSSSGIEDRLQPMEAAPSAPPRLLVIDGLQHLASTSQQRILAHVKQLRESVEQGSSAGGLVFIVHSSISHALESRALDHELFESLADCVIAVPSLAARRDDILDMARHFVNAINQHDGQQKVLSVDLENRIRDYDWPGNVHELKFVIHELYHRSADHPVIENDDAVSPMLLSQEQQSIRDFVGKSFWELQRALLFETLASEGGDKQRAADILGISLKTMYNRLRDYR